MARAAIDAGVVDSEGDIPAFGAQIVELSHRLKDNLRQEIGKLLARLSPRVEATLADSLTRLPRSSRRDRDNDLATRMRRSLITRYTSAAVAAKPMAKSFINMDPYASSSITRKARPAIRCSTSCPRRCEAVRAKRSGHLQR